MIRLPRPRSLAGWTAVVLVLGLLSSQAISLAIYAFDRTALLELTHGERMADRVLLLDRVLRALPEDERDYLIPLLAEPGLLGPPPMPGFGPRDGAGGPGGLGLGPPPPPPPAFALLDRLGPPPQPQPPMIVTADDGTQLQVNLPLLRSGGLLDRSRLMPPMPGGPPAYLRIRAEPVPSLGFNASRFLIAMGCSALLLIALALWVNRRLTSPLKLLETAAERFSADLDGASVPEDGPREVAKAAAAFNRMQGRLRRMMQDRTLMLAAISHDLRTPLTRMRLRAEFVEDDEMRARMLRDLDEMDQMISASLSYARSESQVDPVTDVALHDLVTEVVEDALEQNWAVSAPPAGTILPEVWVRARRPGLKRALVNLVQNAHRYGGGAEIILYAGPAMGCVDVADRGPGLPEDALEAVFTPFHRQESSRNRETGGTGLGLTVARSIARNVGGDVVLANRPGGGLVATLTVPLAPAEGEAPNPGPGAAQSPAGSTRLRPPRFAA
ncbi:ATP-binding protein [Zavarzinia sp. CC-PAN008]|uniref:ATP-binding protein n=1 Tax=Zavarzinia sp. CC-PAN008 TaxID=3243332 RepID=UPI003F7489B4